MVGNDGDAFGGSVPEFYQRYMVPLHFAPHAQVLAARLADLRSGHVLEVAAGTGAATRALRLVLPDAVRITATDLNEAMLEQARLQPGAEGVEWQSADAASLPFPDGSFDAVVCQFGVMFFPDRLAGFREALRVLRPNGRYLFNVWDRMEVNLLSATAQRVIGKLFPENPSSGHFTAFSCADRGSIRANLTETGFGQIDIEEIAGFSRTPSAQLAATSYIHGGVLRNEIASYGPGSLDRATSALLAEIEVRFGNGPVEMPNQALLVTAHRPQV
jgi:ubiquinone/menaquinone biosynthesis C-methylase UbiE